MRASRRILAGLALVCGANLLLSVLLTRHHDQRVRRVAEEQGHALQQPDLGSVISTIVAIYGGFSMTFLVGSAGYLAAGLCGLAVARAPAKLAG